MFAIFSMGQKLFDKLQRKAYRASYVGEHVRRGISYQIRALRDQREWNQGDLSRELGKPQSVVCRLEDPGYGKVTVQTLLEVASAFDVALQVRFVPFSTFLQQSRDVSPTSMKATSFNEEMKSRGALTLKLAPLSERQSVGIQIFDTGVGDLPAPASTGSAKPASSLRLELETAATLQ